MQLSSSDIDETEISHALGRTKIDLRESAKKYAEVEWVPVEDSNADNYTAPLKWDTTPLKSRYPVFRESYVALPIEVDTAGTAYGATTKLAVKCSTLSFINTLMVRPVGGGATLVNEQDGQLPLMNNVRLLTGSDLDWIECSGPELHFFGCDRSIKSNPIAAGWVANTAQSSLGSAVPSHDIVGNAQLADRITIFSAHSAFGAPALVGATSIGIIVTIPLKYIHSFFDQLSFPLPNYPMVIQMGLSSISSGQSGFMPLTTPTQGSVLGGFNAAAAAVTVAVAAPADLPRLKINKLMQINGVTLGSCRLFVKCVTFAGADAEAFDKELSAGYKKQITFLTTDIYREDNVAAPAGGVQYRRVFAENTKRPVRLWTLFPKAGSLTSATSTFPSTIGNAKIADVNIKVNGTQIRRTNYMDQLELYNELRPYQLGSSYASIQGGPISYNDFYQGSKLYMFDLSRQPAVINNLPVTLTFDGKLSESGGQAVDRIFLVERYQTAFLNISKSQASTDVEDGLSKKEQ